MRHGPVAVLLALLTFPAAATEWTEALARARREQKPLVVFFRPARCEKCAYFETLLRHPAVERRLPQVVLITSPFTGNWPSRRPGMGLFDPKGTLRARWEVLPADATTLSTILDGAIAAAPHLARAAALFEAGPHEGELELALALSKIGHTDAARQAVNRAVANGSPRTQQLGIVGRAMLDLAEGKHKKARTALENLTREAISSEVAAVAWMGLGFLHRARNEVDEAIAAYGKAVERADPQSDDAAVARQALAALRETAKTQASSVIHIVPFTRQIVTGRYTVRTLVQSAAVARVVFSVDGVERATVSRPPFSASIAFSDVPQAQTVRAVALDGRGKEIGRAEAVVNNAGETFWLRLLEPREGPASGKVRVSATLRAPAGLKVRRVVVSWKDAERAVLTSPPWRTEVTVPQGELGVLRAVAELEDGRAAEDAVLLNASGFTDRADVPLVELPVTITGGAVNPSDIIVREGNEQRAVESVVAGNEAPLTVGLLIDTSQSMNSSLADVQEAAIRFLDTALGPNDRAFLIAFDSTARLVQTPTTDRARLRERILALHPEGHTALHDAMILGLLQFEGVKGRRALVVFSDGADRTSRYQNGDVEELARRSNIPIFAIAAAPKVTRPLQTIILSQLARVCDSTGGWMHKLSDLSGIDEVYGRIEADLRAQSLVIVRTDPGKSENDWRQIDVTVAGRANVRAPEGYYAPW